jgi:excisionase family DNA binding protein
MADPDKTFGDKEAVARMLGVTTKTVQNLMARGMPHIRLGSRRTRFDLPEVRKWIKDQFEVRRRAPRPVATIARTEQA